MENAADALQMAAFVLIFVLALSISINAFGEVRQTSQIILDYKDREYDYTYVEDNGTTQRIVGAETMIPSIYKAYRENYKIVFQFNDDTYLYSKKDKDNPNGKKIYYIDLEEEVLGSDEHKEKFIKTLLYGYENSEDVKIFTDAGLSLPKEGLYDKIKGKKFKEYLGIYYQEEVQGQSNTPDANRTQKRVITYKEE